MNRNPINGIRGPGIRSRSHEQVRPGISRSERRPPSTVAPLDDFLGDDDLEFKPASAASATLDDSETADPAPIVTDDNEVPSLLFSDDPQAGDR